MTATDRFEWFAELPPRRHVTPPQYADRELIRQFAAALKARPRVWAKWPSEIAISTARAYQVSIEKATMPAFRAGGFAAATRNAVLYVRYVGAVGDPATPFTCEACGGTGDSTGSDWCEECGGTGLMAEPLIGGGP